MSPPQVIQIIDRDTGSSAQVLASLGFNCFSWRPMLGDGPREMLWAEAGFAGGDKRPSGSGVPLLFPFPGRIGGTKFVFNSREYQLVPGDAFGNAIHGFVYDRPWRIVEQSESRVVGEFQASLDDASILARWPADFLIRVSYEVGGRELTSDISYKCLGAGPLPCGFGAHAYFRLPLAEGCDPSDTIITAPAQGLWEAEQMLPTGRILPLEEEHTLTTGLRLGNHKFDTYFTNLEPDDEGQIRTRLRDPNSGRILTQSFSPAFTQCIIYTPPHREAICLEPYTCVPDAQRLSADGHATGQQILQPGESFETRVRINVNG